MDEVPIATTNPVKIMASSSKPSNTKVKPVGTFMNFFFMMPLAVIILIQVFYFGDAIGKYTTFPVYTIQSYMTLGAVLVALLLLQIFLRSITYSTLAGFLLVAGVFHAWFGNFWGPLFVNVKEVIPIFKSAISNRDIPFPLLMTTILSVVLFLAAGANFLLSLFVKYFFEIIFGVEWSDGRRTGFFSAIFFLAFVHGGLYVYAKNSGNPERILWHQKSLYQPLEEYCHRIPSASQFSRDRVWNYDPKEVFAIDASSGKDFRKKSITSIVPSKFWSMQNFPVIASKQGLVAFDRDLLSESWATSYPEKLPELELPPEEEQPGLGVPLLIIADISENFLLAMHDYGYWSATSLANGKLLWLKSVDVKIRSRYSSVEEFISGAYVIPFQNLVIFSCTNGRITALKSDTGETAWDFKNNETEFGRKTQRAFLTEKKGKIVAAFPSGSIVVLDAQRGTKERENRISKGHPMTPAYWDGDEVDFMSTEGYYIRLRMDGGDELMRVPVCENRPPLIPLPVNIAEGFLGYRENFYQISSSTRSINLVYSFPKHIFAAKPLVDGAFVYIGTQDGWVHCFHRFSFDEKWRVHLSGELVEDSLAINELGILVRTRSGSIYCLKKGTS